MNNFPLFRHGVPYVIGILAFLNSSPILAQYEDDPNRDQLPWELRNIIPENTDATLSTTITVNNFDNFNLGVDFGEGNIAANPLVPAWFFTAYNTNDAHHTENGISWTDI